MARIAFLAVLAVVAGCGGDDEPSGDSSQPATQTESGPTTGNEDRTDGRGDTETETEDRTETGSSGGGAVAPEDEEGGAGDEEPARSQALLTGRGGRIRPGVVRVPPYISIRVELRSADGRTYTLRFGRRRIRAGGQISSASSSFPGLRPGKALVGSSVGAGNRVRIVANAEPGP